MQVSRRVAALLVTALALLPAAACGGAGDGTATAPAPAVSGGKGDLGRDATAGPATGAPGDAAAGTATRLPLGAQPGFDDLDQNGSPDPTCIEHDYGGGLVLRLLCNYTDYAQAPAEGTTLVPESLFGLPSPDLDLTGISGSVGMGRTRTAGRSSSSSTTPTRSSSPGRRTCPTRRCTASPTSRR